MQNIEKDVKVFQDTSRQLAGEFQVAMISDMEALKKRLDDLGLSIECY